MSALRFALARSLPFRVLLKTGLTIGALVVIPLYAVLAWLQMGHPVGGTIKGLSLLLLFALVGGGLWRIVRFFGFRRRGGPGSGPNGPQVREPRPPGGRPPALSAAARAEDRPE